MFNSNFAKLLILEFSYAIHVSYAMSELSSTISELSSFELNYV